jgi:hypothetical protein
MQDLRYIKTKHDKLYSNLRWVLHLVEIKYDTEVFATVYTIIKSLKNIEDTNNN